MPTTGETLTIDTDGRDARQLFPTRKRSTEMAFTAETGDH